MKSRIRLSLISSLAIVFLLVLGSMVGSPALAQDRTVPAVIDTDIIFPVPSVVDVPGSTLDKKAEYLAEGKVEDLAQYLGIIYNFLISIVGLVASVMMVVGGFQYLTSAGDSGKIGAAKTKIMNAFIGLVLALGAYTILKTINPDLVVLKVPTGVKDVSTEVISLPWCDEVAAQGTTVNAVWGDPNICGSAGEFLNGKSRLVCLYRGACPLHKTDVNTWISDGKSLYSTCVQTLTTSMYMNDPYTSDEILAEIYEDYVVKEFKAKGGVIPDWPDTPEGNAAARIFSQKNLLPLIPPFGTVVNEKQFDLARCMSCLEYGASEKKSSGRSPSGYDYQTAHEGRCSYWQNLANGGIAFAPGAWEKRKAAGQPQLSYCRWMPEERGCAQADFSCNLENEPDSSFACMDYNLISPFYMFRLDLGGYTWWEYGSKIGTLSARPDALQSVCNANPCGYNMPEGCGGAGGLLNGIRTAAAIARDGISGIQSCVNN